MTAITPEIYILKNDLAQQLDSLNQIQDLLNAYVIKNLLLVGAAPTSHAITFINPNLYSVAVQYYGDANLWTVIANANGLDDWNLSGMYTLLIPPKPSVSSDSILNPPNPSS